MNLELLKKVGGVKEKKDARRDGNLFLISEEELEEFRALKTLEAKMNMVLASVQRSVQNVDGKYAASLAQFSKLSDEREKHVSEVIRAKGSESSAALAAAMEKHEKDMLGLKELSNTFRRELEMMIAGAAEKISNLHEKYSVIETKHEAAKKDFSTSLTKVEKKGLVMRDELRKKFEDELKLVRKGISEMGYSLQLLSNDVFIGMTPALNFHAGSGMTISTAFVNGIPKVSFTASALSGTQEKSTTTPNGVHTTFAFAHTPSVIAWNGAIQTLTDDYTVSGNNITFTASAGIPQTGDKVINIYA